MKPSNQKVCAVLCTYGRFEIVRQSITMFLSQDYKNKELLIFNTAEVPFELGPELLHRKDVRVVNQKAKSDGTPFTCLGDVRNAALEHAEGDIYVCWDDDDVFFPWHLSQCMKHYCEVPQLAWKPDVSYFSHDGGQSFVGVMGNAMEASFVVHMDTIKEHGFSTERSGGEHVDGGWLSLTEHAEKNISPFESYGYVWGDDRAPHKTSGNIGDDNNFENHKTSSNDFGEGKLLSPAPLSVMDKFLKAALEMWETQNESDMAGHSATKERIEELRDMMRDFYHRFLRPLPNFLYPKDPVKEALQQELSDLMNRVKELQQKLDD